MTTALANINGEKASILAEQIKAIIAHAREATTIEMIAMKYMIGEEIATHELYRKHAKNQGKLYEAVSVMTGVRAVTLSECVKLYEAYPERRPKAIAEKLYTEHGAWRHIRLSLYGDPDAPKTTKKRVDCRHCPIHCR